MVQQPNKDKTTTPPPSQASAFKNLGAGAIGVVQLTEDGRIIQLGLNAQQSQMLQAFVACMSQDQPLIKMGKEYDLELKQK